VHDYRERDFVARFCFLAAFGRAATTALAFRAVVLARAVVVARRA